MRVNRRVGIWKHVRLADGKWRYCRPVLDAKDKIVPHMVRVKGVEEHHAEGNYVISFYDPILTWRNCGLKPADAVAAAERQRALFKAQEHGIVERPKKAQTTGTIDEAVSEYLQELEAKVGNGSKRPRTQTSIGGTSRLPPTKVSSPTTLPKLSLLWKSRAQLGSNTLKPLQ